MNKKQKHAALVAAMVAIVDGAKALGRSLTSEEIADIDAKETEATQLKAEIELEEKGAALAARVGAMTSAGDVDPTSGEKGADKAPAKSLGDHVVKSIGGKLKGRRGDRQVSEAAPEFKAAGDVHVVGAGLAPAYTQVDTNVVAAPRRELTIEDLLGAETISGAALTYFIEGALEGAPATVGENKKKPQLHFADPTPVTVALAKVAAWVKESDELLEDLPWLATSIDGRLLYQLGLFVEDQLLNGDGTGTNILGLLNRSGIQVESSAAAADNADAIFRAMTKVQNGSGFAADGLVINPADYQQLRLSKDGNGQYYGGGMFAGQYGNGPIMEKPGVWGLRTVVTPAIAPGTALVGAYKQSASVLSKGGVRVDVTNTNEDDFIHNRLTMLAERRLQLAGRRPAGFAKVTLSDVVAAGE